MKIVRRLLDNVRPHVKRGGRFGAFFQLFEAIDTFLFTTGKVTHNGPHVRDGLDIKRTMITVCYALIPVGFMTLFNTGFQANQAIAQGAASDGWRAIVMIWLGLGFDGTISHLVHGALWFIPVFLVTNIVGGFWEVLFASVRKHEINEGFLVTGMLFPLILPPTIPLWQVAVGISFGVVIGKEVFGGTGFNILNPALTARAFLYFAYPAEMSGDTVWIGMKSAATAVDGFSGATGLSMVVQGGVSAITHSWWDAFIGMVPGSMGETSFLACLIGAIFLIQTGVGSWRIMLSCCIGLSLTVLFFTMVGSETNQMINLPLHWHLVLGGFAFGVVFMATDPVSASSTQAGRWIYGFLIGVLTALIRVINPAYPEGIMLAILLMNVFAPFIDYLVIRAHLNRRAARYEA